MLVILPFWTSFLLRVYAWMGLLNDQGLINDILTGMGFEPFRMMYTHFAVYVGIVYTYVPFMILPLYANMEKLDWTLLEAAADLGAKPMTTFFTVTLPMTLPRAVQRISPEYRLAGGICSRDSLAAGVGHSDDALPAYPGEGG
jgi:putrescine transport system permease protein